MEGIVNELVAYTRQKLESLPVDKRLLISISGVPGSGKTTLAGKVVKGINNGAGGGEVAIMVPMDGYHLPRSALSQMPDPTLAHARRGAPFTFDPASLLSLLHSLLPPLTPTTVTIYAPSFDHALKDPVENDIAILPTHRVVVFEGNYLSLNIPGWIEITQLFDERWVVDVEETVARKRLIERHLKAGIVKGREEAERRAVENDEVNGRLVRENGVVADRVVWSVEDEGWEGS